MAKQRIGFIGLGVMGAPMCRNLCRRLTESPTTDSAASTLEGYSISAFDLDHDRLQSAVEAGASAAQSIAALAAGSDLSLIHI